MAKNTLLVHTLGGFHDEPSVSKASLLFSLMKEYELP